DDCLGARSSSPTRRNPLRLRCGGRSLGQLEGHSLKMRLINVISCLLATLACAVAQTLPTQTQPPSKRFVIAASVVLDGKGRVLHDTRIVIEGSKILAIDPKAGPVDYDLRGLTVLPGWIDAHVHLAWFFKDGKLAGTEATP